MTDKFYFSPFLETRTSGDKTCWGAIKLALQSEREQDINVILESAGLKMLGHSIQMTVDEKIIKYEVPIFCINNPKSFSKTTLAQTNLVRNFVEQEVDVKIRSTKYVTDTVLRVSNKTTIQQLKSQYRAKVGVADAAKLRFFYSGREALDQYEVGSYSFKENDVIQAMIIGG